MRRELQGWRIAALIRGGNVAGRMWDVREKWGSIRMACTSQRWGCGDLAERLRWHTLASLRQGAECSLLIFRPLENTSQAEKSHHTDACDPLPALAERIRPYIRRTDTIELDERNAVAVVLQAVGREGVHAAFGRLRDLLATPPLPGDRTFAITIGYATGTAGATGTALDDERATAATVRAAWKPRVLLRVALACTQARSTPRTDEAAPRPFAAEERKLETAVPLPVAAPTRSPRSLRQSHPRLTALDSPAQPVDEDLRARARALGVPFVQLPARLPASCRAAITSELAHELHAVPIGRSRSVLTVAMHDPRDAGAVLRLRSATGLAIFPVLADPDELERVLRQLSRA